MTGLLNLAVMLGEVGLAVYSALGAVYGLGFLAGLIADHIRRGGR